MLGPESGEDELSISLIFKRQRGRAIGCGDLGQRGQTLDQFLPGPDPFANDEPGAGQKQHRAAGQQSDGHELPPDGLISHRHRPAPPLPTNSDARSNLELIVRLAAFAVSRLIRNRILFFSVKKRTAPPRRANG